MDRVDLHVHTTASDGTLSPRDATSLAAMKGLKAIAITDHDTMAGLLEAGEAGELLGVTIIPGIEISTDYMGEEVHVLGYFLEPTAKPLREYISWVRSARRDRTRRCIEKLQAKGFNITFDQLSADYPDATLGRPHIARELMKLGVVSSVKEAFRKYLDEGRSCYVRREYIPFTKAIKLIRDSGGVAVLAHPLQYGFSGKDLDIFVKTGTEAGATGIEILYPGYTQKDQDKLYTLAEKYSLLPTGGSDFHGDNKPDNPLGEPPVPAYMFLMLAASQFK